MISFDKNSFCSKQLLTNLEDEIFLKGGSVVTPQNFGLVLFIKILPGNKTFPFVKIYPFVIVDFYFKWKTFKRYCWT